MRNLLTDDLGAVEARDVFNDTFRNNKAIIERKSGKFKEKLRILRDEGRNAFNNNFDRNAGSRKLVGKKYMRSNSDGQVLGAPFPRYLRNARRNRPHRRNRVQNCEEFW